MNHFVYAMKSTDPAPATGGDTKSWFEYYKWDVGGHAYVPVPESAVDGLEPNAVNVLWFVMDGVLLGCVSIDAFMPCLQDGVIELHYNTEYMQVAPEAPRVDGLKWTTGIAGDKELMNTLKRSFDAQYPPRNQAADLPQAAT